MVWKPPPLAASASAVTDATMGCSDWVSWKASGSVTPPVRPTARIPSLSSSSSHTRCTWAAVCRRSSGSLRVRASSKLWTPGGTWASG